MNIETRKLMKQVLSVNKAINMASSTDRFHTRFSLPRHLGMYSFAYLSNDLIEKNFWCNATDAIKIYKDFVAIGIMNFDTERHDQYPQTYRSFINLMFDTMSYHIMRYPGKEKECRAQYKKLVTYLLACRYGDGKPYEYYQMEKSICADVQDRFIQQWKSLLTTNAISFKGLFRRLLCTFEKQGKRPQNSISKWYDRTRFLWPDNEINWLTQKTLVPVIIRDDAEECAFWAGIILQAAKEAGINRDDTNKLIVGKSELNNYFAWNGRRLRIGETVNVLYPAWYQQGQLLEKGYVR